MLKNFVLILQKTHCIGNTELLYLKANDTHTFRCALKEYTSILKWQFRTIYLYRTEILLDGGLEFLIQTYYDRADNS
jgi:hypothetical protein